MSKIEIIEYEDSTGLLKEIYDDLIRKRGKLAEVHKIQSLNPESIAERGIRINVSLLSYELQYWRKFYP